MNNLGIVSIKEKEEEEKGPLPGFRFHPTDEELVGFYLQRKVQEKPMIMELIKQIDIYKYDPWDLPKSGTVGENEWYFFCRRGRKYKNSERPNRVTGSGFWKATGIDKPIYSTPMNGSDSGSENRHEGRASIIGLKKSLVYYRGSAGRGTKTDWMMHEFRLPTTDHEPADLQASHLKLTPTHHLRQEAEVWTICRIFKRPASHNTKFSNNMLEDRRQSAHAYKHRPPEASSSTTCSMDSDDDRKYISFETPSTTFQNEHHLHHHQKKNSMDNGRNQLFVNHFNQSHRSIDPETSFSAGSGFPNNQSSMGLLTYEDWDELGSVVEQSLVPSDPFFH